MSDQIFVITNTDIVSNGGTAPYQLYSDEACTQLLPIDAAEDGTIDHFAEHTGIEMGINYLIEQSGGTVWLGTAGRWEKRINVKGTTMDVVVPPPPPIVVQPGVGNIYTISIENRSRLNEVIAEINKVADATKAITIHLDSGAEYDFTGDVSLRSNTNLIAIGTGKMPIVRAHGNTIQEIRGEDNLLFQGIHFVADDVNHYATKTAGPILFRITAKYGGDGKPQPDMFGPIAFVDCEIENGGTVISITNRSNVLVKGCNIHDNSIGLFGSNIAGLTVENNAFYRNGWSGYRTHDIYVGGEDSRDFVIRHNLLGDSTGYAVKVVASVQNVTIEDNFYTGTALGFIVHINHEADTPGAFNSGVIIRNNVGIGNGRDYVDSGGHVVKRQLAINVEGCSDYQVTGNIYAHAHEGGSTAAIQIDADPNTPSTGDRIVRGNIIDDTTNVAWMTISFGATGVVIENNQFTRRTNGSPSDSVAGDNSHANLTWRFNQYDAVPKVMLDGSWTTWTAWLASGRDVTSTIGPINYVDPDRTIETFITTLPAGEGDLFDRFTSGQFTLDQLLSYFRSGYEVQH